MDLQSLVNLAFGIILTGLGWFGRQLWDAVKELRSDLHKIETELPRQYVTREEFRHEIQELKDICKEIFRKIDDLRDKIDDLRDRRPQL
jgi:uncharacterized coiled-coil DUF342 family protein